MLPGIGLNRGQSLEKVDLTRQVLTLLVAGLYVVNYLIQVANLIKHNDSEKLLGKCTIIRMKLNKLEESKGNIEVSHLLASGKLVLQNKQKINYY